MNFLAHLFPSEIDGSLFLCSNNLRRELITTILSISDLTYSHPDAQQPVFVDVSMKIERGEFVSIIGASGCGKSTLFKSIAGLFEPTHGEIVLHDNPPSAKRLGQIAYMPQQDLLLPWRTVLGNCLLPWEIKPSVSKQEILSRIRDLLSNFGLADVELAYPHELSGGMKQRVALLRTLVAGEGSGLMLLDEPFGALDAMTKREIHHWLLELWEKLNQTVLLITHDLEEALLLSDRIYLMSSGNRSRVQEFIVKLPRPRHSRMNYEPDFIALKEELERLLYEVQIH